MRLTTSFSRAVPRNPDTLWLTITQVSSAALRWDASDCSLYSYRDSQAHRSTAEPDPSPEYGSMEWHEARAKANEEAAYERRRLEIEDQRRDPCQSW